MAPLALPKFDRPDLSAANSTYKMTPEDLAADCKQLAGRMAVRIRQLRSERAEKTTSEVSRQLQNAASPWIAGTTRGIDPAGDQARDIGMLQALNARLAEKNCPTFNLTSDLAPGNTAPPRPVKKDKAATVIKPASVPADKTAQTKAPPSAKADAAPAAKP